MTDWQDKIVGDRMTVDDEFSDAVDNSQFSRQEWGLIMTAISFEIRTPADEERAQLVANTSELEGIMPELENVANMGPMGKPQSNGQSGPGFFDSVLGALGLGGDDGDTDRERLEAAERMVQTYAQELQAHLEAEGRWGEVRAAAAEQEGERE